MSEFLFDEFEPVSAKQWKQQIQYDLKGADYNETLLWQSPEGINVKPFYHSDDFSANFQPIPGQPDSWNIAQHIFVDDVSVAKKIAINSLDRGAEAVVLEAEKEFDFENLFSEFPFEKAVIYFHLDFLSEEFLKNLISFFQKNRAKVFFNIDIIGHLAHSGNWFSAENQDLNIHADLIRQHPNFNLLAVDASLYQNAGANMAQEITYALAHANEYLNRISLANQTKSDFNLTFTVAVGSNYFFEIAKIRALRKLYALIASEYGYSQTCHILATPSRRNKTIYDYNVNMLRTTMECMAAVLGGADTVCNMPYDALFHKSNEFGERIARNQLLILKNESYFDKVSNAADGTYYIESITEELASKALQIFKEIEKGGGFLKQLQEGTIQKKIKQSAEKEQALFDESKIKLLGTNYHPNKNDRMKNDLQLFPFVKKNPVKTAIKPIIAKRLSEKTEQERLTQES